MLLPTEELSAIIGAANGDVSIWKPYTDRMASIETHGPYGHQYGRQADQTPIARCDCRQVRSV